MNTVFFATLLGLIVAFMIWYLFKVKKSIPPSQEIKYNYDEYKSTFRLDKKTNLTESECTAEAQKFTAQGYRKISNKYRIIARIDCENWVDIIYEEAFKHRKPGICDAVKAIYDGIDPHDLGFSKDLAILEAKSAADHYRRCFSKDSIEGVDYRTFKLIPTSNWNDTGYCYINEKE